ncbi:MAG: hypothetical protein JSV77_05670 [Dehalococcoidales bacterium]|nr:MAG: hypothetical protein JSV77_05670 [Dehalococcoidales bacterium]
MDWGVVASVIVANILLTFGLLSLIGFMIFLIISGIKKKAQVRISTSTESTDKEATDKEQPGVVRSCPIAFCPMNKVVE